MTGVPLIIEDLSFEKILTEKVNRFTDDYKRDIPEFERPTPADPAYRVLSQLSLTEITIREKINSAGLKQLIRLSDELDFLFAGRRFESESLPAFRERMIRDMNAASPAGPLAMYEGLSFLAANEGVEDPELWPVLDVFAQSKDGKVIVHLLPNSRSPGTAEATQERVKAFLGQKHIKPGLDEFDVLLAVERLVNVSATFQLEPGIGLSIFTAVERNFRNAWRGRSKLGWGPAASWIIGRLDQDGVRSLSLRTPLDDAKLAANEYASIGKLSLTLGAQT